MRRLSVKSYSFNGDLQKEHIGGFALVSWQSVFAGLVVTLFCYITLMALGTAIGGGAAHDIIRDSEGAGGIALGAVIWLLVSAFLSLAVGSYFAARISSFVTKRVGSFQGAIIASLFFALLIYSATSTVGAISGQISSLVATVTGASSGLTIGSRVQNLIEGSFGDDLTLKSDPEVVARGLATRLMQGNDEAAKSYLAYQTGVSRVDIEQRFQSMKSEFTARAQQIGSEVATEISTAGWVLFGTFTVGMLFSILGGSWGASVNFRKPLTEDSSTMSVGTPRPQTV